MEPLDMNYHYFQFPAVAIALYLFIPVVSALSFNLTSFNDTIINCSGNATLSSSRIDLTLNQREVPLNGSSGRAVYNEPLQLWNKDSGEAADFTTHFEFMIINQSEAMPGDGLTFFLAPYPADQIPSNTGGGGLGLFNGSTTQIVAVEFDTYSNPFDPPSKLNHMGIDVNTVLSVTYAELFSASLVNTKYPGHAIISYNARNLTLTARLSYPEDPKLAGVSWNVSYVIDLRNYLPENVSIGFSAATGTSIELHIIQSWDFYSTELKIIAPTSAPFPVPVKRSLPRWIIQAVVNVAILLGLGIVLFVVYCYWRRTLKKNEQSQELELPNIDGILNQSGKAPKKFDYAELVTATTDFSIEKKLGEGGFGAVYRGVLEEMNGLQVAIKKFSKGSQQGIKEYIAEVTIISQLRHRHLVQLIGYCHDRGEFLLVYEYMPNKSLDEHLYSNEKLLGSQYRFKIALDLASALMYLHEGWEHCIVHRDIKPSNVMLDSNFNAKLGDFGLAKLVDHDRSLLATVVAGTRGYMAPEFMETGKAGKECDVYSFGIVALELACGRKPIDVREEGRRVKLADWAWELYERRACLEAVDKRLNSDFDLDRMERLMIVGLWCAHPDYKLRPAIRSAFCVLNFDAILPELPPRMNY